MRVDYRHTYTYPNALLQEYLKEIKSGVLIGDFLLRREILLQSHENGLIKLPDGFVEGDAHMIPASSITFIEQPQNTWHNKH